MKQDLISDLGGRKDKIQIATRSLIRRSILIETDEEIDINPEVLSWKTDTPEKAKNWPAQAFKLAKYLAKSIDFWQPGFIEMKDRLSPKWQGSWSFPIDKLLKAGITGEEIVYVIDKMCRDKGTEHKGRHQGFSWRQNILSGNKLLEKWPKLKTAYGKKSTKVIREKRYYDNEPTLRPGEKWEDFEWKGPDIDKVF
jgi:hypothetical protein